MEMRLNQILTNLIGNAIKFTEKGGVTLEVLVVERKNEFIRLHFSVKDTGIGIDEENLEKIFNRFSQENVSMARRYGGSGLGLTITKRLIELQGGEIEVKSNKGVDTEFSFELLFKVSDVDFQSAVENVNPIVNESLKGRKVLLVEDNNVNVLLATKFLDRWGVVYDVSENGEEAIENVKTNNYDLVLMDIQMPVMDGLEATRYIRTMPEEKKDVPILALTASAMLEIRDEVFKAGMDGFITKPFMPNDLYDKMVRILA